MLIQAKWEVYGQRKFLLTKLQSLVNNTLKQLSDCTEQNMVFGKEVIHYSYCNLIPIGISIQV